MLNQQETIDAANRTFWDELCGSGLAQMLGITDQSKDSLEKFDDGYFDLYPYLMKHIPVRQMQNKDVLEVGLGYGTVGQKIAEAGANYTGLDIAEQPVAMMNHRFQLANLPGKALQGNIIDCTLNDASFDWIVSIGCYHHTGNMQACIDQTYRLLKPHGTAIIMVYNQFSFRQWRRWPLSTLRVYLHQLGLSNKYIEVTQAHKQAYDPSCSSDASAPETEFFSKKQIHEIFKDFDNVTIHKENFDDYIFRVLSKLVRKTLYIPRKNFLPNIAKIFGLDLYIVAQK